MSNRTLREYKLEWYNVNGKLDIAAYLEQCDQPGPPRWVYHNTNFWDDPDHWVAHLHTKYLTDTVTVVKAFVRKTGGEWERIENYHWLNMNMNWEMEGRIVDNLPKGQEERQERHRIQRKAVDLGIKWVRGDIYPDYQSVGREIDRVLSATTTTDAMKDFADAVLKSGAEVFIIEATPNDYEPKPPPGWFGMRSHKNRVFLQLINGCIPGSDQLCTQLAHARRYPLTPPTNKVDGRIQSPVSAVKRPFGAWIWFLQGADGKTIAQIMPSSDEATCRELARLVNLGADYESGNLEKSEPWSEPASWEQEGRIADSLPYDHDGMKVRTRIQSKAAELNIRWDRGDLYPGYQSVGAAIDRVLTGNLTESP